MQNRLRLTPWPKSFYLEQGWTINLAQGPN